jgi:hypothetical protein
MRKQTLIMTTEYKRKGQNQKVNVKFKKCTYEPCMRGLSYSDVWQIACFTVVVDTKATKHEWLIKQDPAMIICMYVGKMGDHIL